MAANATANTNKVGPASSPLKAKLKAAGVRVMTQNRLKKMHHHTREKHLLHHHLTKMDADGDGLIDLDEFIAAGGTEEEFNELDHDGDGVLDLNELSGAKMLLVTNPEAAGVPSLEKWEDFRKSTGKYSMTAYVLSTVFFYCSAWSLAMYLAFELWDHNDNDLPFLIRLKAAESQSIAHHWGTGLTTKADPSPTSELSTLGFQRYITALVTITCILTGLGMEFTFGGYIVMHLSQKGGEILWFAAQMLFSLMLTIGIIGRSAFSLPFVVFGLWKFGFPETVGYFLKAYKMPGFNMEFFSHYLNGLGLLLHHSAGCYFVASLCTHLMELVRITLAGTIVLVVQHWFVVLKYYSVNLYIIIELCLEVYFEFELISAIPEIRPRNGADTTLRGCALIMLFAHWCYLASSTLALAQDWFGDGEESTDSGTYGDLKKDVEAELARPSIHVRKSLDGHVAQAASPRHFNGARRDSDDADETTSLVNRS